LIVLQDLPFRKTLHEGRKKDLERRCRQRLCSLA